MVELEEGRFYLTRDGRKIGPAHESGNYWEIPGEWHFCHSNDGIYCGEDRGLDIVGVFTNIPSPEDPWRDGTHYVHPSATSGAQREKLNALPYDLVPFQEIADAYSRVAEKGAVKYAPWNWSKGLSRVQLVGSLLRHTWAYLRGEECDKETGLNHTDHILWNAVALTHNVRWNLEDGRRGEPERNYKNPLDKPEDSE